MSKGFLKLQFVLLFLMMQSEFVFAQGEFNNWYFGYEAGITFNSGVPVFTSGGQTFTDEGVASVSDPSGNLLFYTDGQTVWNRDNSLQKKGSFGNKPFKITCLNQI